MLIEASQIEDNVLRDLASSSYCAIITDESTDISVLKQLVLAVRYVLSTGDATISFLVIVDLQEGIAKSIEAALVKIMETKSID